MVGAIKLKSVTSLHQCLQTTFLLVLFMTPIKSLNVQETMTDILADLPGSEDIDTYLTALEQTLDFCLSHKIYVDINLEFGVFLINVNLKNAFDEKSPILPEDLRHRLDQIMVKVKIIEQFFQVMVQKTNQLPQYSQERAIAKLFRNESLWHRNVPKFSTDLLKRTKLYSTENLMSKYGEWPYYVFGITDTVQMRPTPKESAACLASLVQTPPMPYSRGIPTACITGPNCRRALRTGHGHGYGLIFRIIFMTMARYSRGCVLFSKKDDKSRMDDFCMMAFNEAQYIALNNFQEPAIMFAQMALCGLSGHAQYNRKSWFKGLLEYQTAHGCFNTRVEADQHVSNDDVELKWTIRNINPHTVMNGQCNSYLTGMAAGALSSALKYILETYRD